MKKSLKYINTNVLNVQHHKIQHGAFVVSVFQENNYFIVVISLI